MSEVSVECAGIPDQKQLSVPRATQFPAHHRAAQSFSLSSFGFDFYHDSGSDFVSIVSDIPTYTNKLSQFSFTISFLLISHHRDSLGRVFIKPQQVDKDVVSISIR